MTKTKKSHNFKQNRLFPLRIIILLITSFLTLLFLTGPAEAQQAREINEKPPVIAVGRKCFLNSRKIDIHTGPGRNTPKAFITNSQGKKYLTLDTGYIVKIEEIKNKWVRISVVKPAYRAKKYKGWIEQKYLRYMPTKEEYAAMRKEARKKSGYKKDTAAGAKKKKDPNYSGAALAMIFMALCIGLPAYYFHLKPAQEFKKILQKYRLTPTGPKNSDFKGTYRGKDLHLKTKLSPPGYRGRRFKYYALEIPHEDLLKVSPLEIFFKNRSLSPVKIKPRGKKLKIGYTGLDYFDFFLENSNDTISSDMESRLNDLIDRKWSDKLLKLRGEGSLWASYLKISVNSSKIVIEREIMSMNNFENMLKTAVFILDELKKLD